MDVMSSTRAFSLVIIIFLFHNVVLQDIEGRNDIENGLENYIEGESGSNIENKEYKVVNFEDEDNAGNEERNNTEMEEQSSASSESSDISPVRRIPATFRWPAGTVPYRIKKRDYDSIVAGRIRQAMLAIEKSSCVVFKDLAVKKNMLKNIRTPWLSIENPDKQRECLHTTLREEGALDARKAILVIGYACMQQRDILHALLHALGFRDEVTHPQRDLYIRIVWPNIQMKYRSLFYVQKGETPKNTVEFDSMSVMHFHDRAYTINGGATILPQIPGLLIAPSDTLSQLDVMKLRLAFGHECNKRKVAKLLRTCQNILIDDDNKEDDNNNEDENTEADNNEADNNEDDNNEDDNNEDDNNEDDNNEDYKNEDYNNE